MTIAIVQANISYIVFGVMSPYPTVVMVITAQSGRSGATLSLVRQSKRQQRKHREAGGGERWE
jgi:hypothetical protein